MSTILICEDDIPLASYWRRLLEAQGHTVYCGETVAQVLQLACKISPDLIITDMMIKQDGQFSAEGGLTLVSRLRRNTQLSAPIICVSGYRPTEYNSLPALEIAKAMEIDLALYKPITPGKLLISVQKLLRNNFQTT